MKTTTTRRTILAGAATLPLLPAAALAAPVTLPLLPVSAFATPADPAIAAHREARLALPALPDQIAGVREALQGLGEASPEQVARHFKRGRSKTVEPLLETLAALGQARKLGDGRYAC